MVLWRTRQLLSLMTAMHCTGFPDTRIYVYQHSRCPPRYFFGGLVVNWAFDSLNSRQRRNGNEARKVIQRETTAVAIQRSQTR